MGGAARSWYRSRMGTYLAETVPHRARLAWLAAALLAFMGVVIALSPAPAEPAYTRGFRWHDGRCIDVGDNGPHYVRVDVVHSYHR